MSYHLPCPNCDAVGSMVCKDTRASIAPGVCCQRTHECIKCGQRVYTNEFLVKVGNQELYADSDSSLPAFTADVVDAVQRHFAAASAFNDTARRGYRTDHYMRKGPPAK